MLFFSRSHFQRKKWIKVSFNYCDFKWIYESKMNFTKFMSSVPLRDDILDDITYLQKHLRLIIKFHQVSCKLIQRSHIRWCLEAIWSSICVLGAQRDFLSWNSKHFRNRTLSLLSCNIFVTLICCCFTHRTHLCFRKCPRNSTSIQIIKSVEMVWIIRGSVQEM